MAHENVLTIIIVLVVLETQIPRPQWYERLSGIGCLLFLPSPEESAQRELEPRGHAQASSSPGKKIISCHQR